MGIIFIKKLDPKPRTVVHDGRCIDGEWSAFIGATDSELCEFGIGVVNEETKQCHYWALFCPQMLITAWRGMQVLDKTTSILHGTICHAYYAGESIVDSDVKKAIENLSKQVPDFRAFRESVLKMKIDDEELDEMLKICNDPSNSININTHELEEAIEAGVINHTSEVTRAYEIEVEQRSRDERNKLASKQPLPATKSFRKFCEEFGLSNLFSDPDDDFPGYRSLECIDESLVYNGLSFEGYETIWCAENPQKAFDVGHVGQPVLQLNDQRTVVLSSVRYKDDDMWGAIHAVKGKDRDEWLTLSELSALNPRLVGLTFGYDKNISPDDAARGYFATHVTKPKKAY